MESYYGEGLWDLSTVEYYIRDLGTAREQMSNSSYVPCTTLSRILFEEPLFSLAA